MKPMIPGEATRQDIWNKSVAQVLLANVSLGTGTKYDASNIPTEYAQDNGSGILVRSVFGANVDTVLTHNLGRVPVGYFVTRAYAATMLYDAGTNAGWTKTEIVLRSSAAADLVVYIF